MMLSMDHVPGHSRERPGRTESGEREIVQPGEQVQPESEEREIAHWPGEQVEAEERQLVHVIDIPPRSSAAFQPVDAHHPLANLLEFYTASRQVHAPVGRRPFSWLGDDDVVAHLFEGGELPGRIDHIVDEGDINDTNNEDTDSESLSQSESSGTHGSMPSLVDSLGQSDDDGPPPMIFF